MRKVNHISLLIMVLCAVNSFGQAPKKLTSAEIYEKIEKLQVLASALYVAAHPDDENTRLIAYLANEEKANTAYLSLTRGDGGQNLIGPEIRELLGVIRTQELLAARGVDGGQQMFSRANDFGYSKTPKETFDIWNKEEVLADVVWAIRKFRPDVIINRFSHDSGRRTHGHHTGSAMLSVEAFDMVGKKKVYPEQLKHVDVWQPKRIFHNTSWWFYGSQEKFEKAMAKQNLLSVDAGVYYPLKGKSNGEIAAESRSMHKCQGFGSTGSRGTQKEYLQLIKGDEAEKGIFEGINTTWTRVKGGQPIGELLATIQKNFDLNNPAASVPQLMKAYKMIGAIKDEHWKAIKSKEIKEVIKGCMGLYVEGVASDVSATPGQDVKVNVEMINRSSAKATVKSIEFLPGIKTMEYNKALNQNERLQETQTISLPKDIEYTNAYWLQKKWELGMYTVEDQLMRGLPESPRPFSVRFNLEIEGVAMDFVTEIVYKRNDPVKGETYSPFEITPSIYANLTEKVFIFSDTKSKTVNVLLKSGKENVSGTLELCHPEGWKVKPEKVDFELKMKGEEQMIAFELFPPEQQDENFIVPLVRIGEESYTQELVKIAYDHIPTQTVMRDASAKVVKVDLKKLGNKVAYIMGSGDAIPESLEQVGYDVTVLKDNEITVDNLSNYDALIIGIRAYNTNERMKFHQSKLMEYVENGGTMIVQYNTSRRLKVKDLAPYPLTVSRDRVSVEEAEIRILKPDHPVLNTPNKITEKDFENWVQERGLYFPNKWDDKFDAILSSNDPGESPKDGGLLVTKYGKGYYIYTGYSWFRELPAGVPGAFRLFTNLISIGQRP